MRIQPGQIYRAIKPSPAHPDGTHIRIKVVSTPYPGALGFGAGKVDVVTVTSTGREVRRRAIEASQLHASTVGAWGKPRRTGYVLETAEAGQ